MASSSSSQTRARRASSLSPCSEIKRQRTRSGTYLTDEMRSPGKPSNQDCAVSAESSDSSPTSTNRRSYLEGLSSEAVHNIVRYMSARPRHRNWRSFVETSSLLALYRTGGHISEVCLTLFRDVTVCAISSGGGENGDFVVRNMKDVAHLMDFAGPFLNKVTFAALPQDLDSCSVESNVHMYPLAFKCGSIKTLDLLGIQNDALFNRILVECRGTLESLYAFPRSKENIAAMVRNCGGLRDLELFITDESSPEFSSIWPALGSTLQKLKLYGGRNLSPEEIHHIQTHCRKLRHIDIPGCPVSVADLIVSYGGQLEYAQFNDMGAELCQRISESCPNMSCSATLSIDLVAVSRVFGPKLRELNVRCVERASLTGLEDSMQHCSNLKSICVKGLENKSHSGLISAFFSSPKPQLEILKLSEVSKASCADDLGYIAASTGGLRDFTLCCTELPPKVLLPIATSNPSLEKVEIIFNHGGTTTGSILVEILESFSICPHLCELVIDSESDISISPFMWFTSRSYMNVCNRYRFKKTNVCVFENDLFS